MVCFVLRHLLDGNIVRLIVVIGLRGEHRRGRSWRKDVSRIHRSIFEMFDDVAWYNSNCPVSYLLGKLLEGCVP